MVDLLTSSSHSKAAIRKKAASYEDRNRAAVLHK